MRLAAQRGHTHYLQQHSLRATFLLVPMTTYTELKVTSYSQLQKCGPLLLASDIYSVFGVLSASFQAMQKKGRALPLTPCCCRALAFTWAYPSPSLHAASHSCLDPDPHRANQILPHTSGGKIQRERTEEQRSHSQPILIIREFFLCKSTYSIRFTSGFKITKSKPKQF
jgi:hypothetical protein